MTMSNSYLRIIIVEKIDDIPSLIKYYDDNTLFLSLSASVSLELKRNGFRYHNTLKYFETKDHSFVVKMSHAIIGILKDKYIIVKNKPENETYKETVFYYMRNVINYVLVIESILDNIVSKIKPNEIVVALGCDSYCSVTKKPDNLLQNIVNQYCIYKSINFKVVGVGNKNKDSQKHDSMVVSMLKSVLCTTQLVLFKLIHRNNNTVIGSSVSYNIDRLVSDVAGRMKKPLQLYISVSKGYIYRNIGNILKGKIYLFVAIPDKFIFSKHMVQNGQTKIIKNYRNIMDKNKDLFIINGISVGDVILNFLNAPQIIKEMKSIEYYHYFLSELLLSGNILTAFAPHVVGMNSVLGELCKSLNIPAFVVSHGTVTKQINEAKIAMEGHSQYLIGNTFPYVAVQTSVQNDFLKDISTNYSKVVETGALLFASVSKNKIENLKRTLYKDDFNKVIILHTGTPSTLNFFEPWIFETQDEYISNINDIIESLRDVTNVYLVIKIRMKHFPRMTIDDVNDLFIKTSNSTIRVYGAFEDYLATADLLVSFSSTTIEEALNMKVPVLQYDPFREYQHLQGKFIKENENTPVPIYSVFNKNKLKDTFEWIIKNHLYSNKKEAIDWSKYVSGKNIENIINVVSDR